MIKNNVILTDCDGCLLDWEYAFDIYLRSHGFRKTLEGNLKYDIGKRYGIDREQGRKLIKIFNESAHIGFLPPLRDAMHYVKKLHEEYGYVFHCITSLSADSDAQALRQMNLEKLFGKTAFEKFVFLDTGSDKDEALEPYRDTGYFWIEDKIQNCLSVLKVGLRPLLMEHGHNMDYEDKNIPRMLSWKQIHDHVLAFRDR
jgi:uncharacterized HAD superfamily protein